jgi:DNA-binding MarR family transcriptional regulator
MSVVTEPAQLADVAISVGAHLEAELDEALAEHRLTRPSYLVLDALERADGGRLPQRELVSRVRRTAGAMSVRLGRLQRAGLIDRERDPESRRAVTVSITDRGRELVVAARPSYELRAERLLAGLPDAGREALAEQLPAWLQFFEPDERTAPRLGVAVVPSAVASRMRAAVGLSDEPGVLVVRVLSDSPAGTAGVRRGDLITAAAGDAIGSLGDLDRAVRTARGSLGLSVLRGSEPHELDVALGD